MLSVRNNMLAQNASRQFSVNDKKSSKTVGSIDLILELLEFCVDQFTVFFCPGAVGSFYRQFIGTLPLRTVLLR